MGCERCGEPLNQGKRFCSKRCANLRHGESFHGKSRTPEYVAWTNMKARCYDPTVRSYPRYGGRGISVCDRWRGSFENFLADMGRKPTPRHSIDRKDNDGNYEPSNCRWATPLEQAANTSIPSGISGLARAAGLKRETVFARLRKGWPLDRALTTPPRTYDKGDRRHG